MSIKWGLIGASKIAYAFCDAIRQLGAGAGEITAVAATDLDRANTFAQNNQIPQAFGSYEQMLKDAKVDAVYISNIHPKHYESCLLAIQYNKHILCEKPMCLSRKQAAEIFKKAREKNLFCIEALWTRFNPLYNDIRNLIMVKRTIGEVRSVSADFSFNAPFDPESRIFNKELGGGALLDLGVYGINFARMFLSGKISSIKSKLVYGQSGVDETADIILTYDSGKTATVSASVRRYSGCNAFIYGTRGYFEIPDFYAPRKFFLYRNEYPMEEYKTQLPQNLYQYEIAETVRCIQKKKTQSQIMPHKETLYVHKIMDTVLKQNPTN